MDHRWSSNVWLLLRPSDVKGQWVAHCLNLDLVTEGSSAWNALEMAVEAIAMVVSDDLQEGRDPNARREAPQEYWDELRRITIDGSVFDASHLLLRRGVPEDERWEAAAMQIQVTTVVRTLGADRDENVEKTDPHVVPTGWAKRPGDRPALLPA